MSKLEKKKKYFNFINHLSKYTDQHSKTYISHLHGSQGLTESTST